MTRSLVGSEPLSRLRVGLVFLGIIALIGTFGYWLAGWNVLDSVYMVATVLSTVGLGEVHELTPELKLFTTLPGDADNVFITLTSRNLNPELMIIARGEFLTTEKKLIQAGADRVVLPAATAC